MSARSKSRSMSLRLIRRRRKSAHRNSLNGVVSFAYPPALPLSLDLSHAYGNLGWAQVGDTYRLKNGFADRRHWMLLYMPSLVYSWGLTARPLAGRIPDH